jgi:hypothetical protein
MSAEEKKRTKKQRVNNTKRPFAKSDFEAVLKAATRPLKQEQGEKESEGTSESRHPDGST